MNDCVMRCEYCGGTSAVARHGMAVCGSCLDKADVRLMVNQTVHRPLYSVGTWDSYRQAYTPQRGLSVPSFNITRAQLRIAMKELRSMWYSVHRRRAADGTHEDNDWSVLIERTDGKNWKEIRRSWER